MATMTHLIGETKQKLMAYYDYIRSEIDIRAQTSLLEEKFANDDQFKQIYSEMIEKSKEIESNNLDEIGRSFMNEADLSEKQRELERRLLSEQQTSNKSQQMIKDEFVEEMMKEVLVESGFLYYIEYDKLSDDLKALLKLAYPHLGLLFHFPSYLGHRGFDVFWTKTAVVAGTLLQNPATNRYDEYALFFDLVFHYLSQNAHRYVSNLIDTNRILDDIFDENVDGYARNVVSQVVSSNPNQGEEDEQPSKIESYTTWLKLDERADFLVETAFAFLQKHMHKIEFLRIQSSSKYACLESNCLAGLVNLNTLDLTNVNPRIDDEQSKLGGRNLFAGLANLDTLRLTATKWSLLDLTGLAKLRLLEMNNCYIEQIQPNTFENIKSLEKLDLRSSYVNKMLPNEFAHLKNLKTIYAVGFDFKTNPFKELPSLRKIDLTCQFYEQFYDDFKNTVNQNLNQLLLNDYKLNLKNCGHKCDFTSQLKLDNLRNVIKLELYDLRHLDAIPNGLFDHMAKLQYLEIIIAPALKQIHASAFKSLTSLVSLRLEFNQLGKRNAKLDFLRPLANLTELALISCDLTDIDLDSLRNLNKLSMFDYSFNPIEKELDRDKHFAFLTDPQLKIIYIKDE